MKEENVLVTIRLSHYCEKARWALQYAGIAFRESAHAPLFHVPPVKRAGGKRPTPVLRTPSAVYADSTDILRFVDERLPPERRLFPDGEAGAEVAALEASFDDDLGPHVRRYLYFYLLAHRRLAIDTLGRGVPGLERFLLPAFYPLIRKVMRSSMRIHAEGAARSKEKVDRVFADVSERLRDGRTYLAGGRFTAADLTFAALAAPIVNPPSYGADLPADDTLPPELLGLVADWRASPAAEHVRRMYRMHRG